MTVRKEGQEKQGQARKIWVWTVCPLGGVQCPTAGQSTVHTVQNFPRPAWLVPSLGSGVVFVGRAL